MLFAVSGVECSPFLLFFAAMAISFFTSMGGISGAFLLLPFQIGVLGYTTPSVSATNQLYNVLACPAGVWRYWREGRLLMPLVFYMAAGTLPGVFLGAWLRAGWLADLRRFMLFAAIVLGYIGIRLFFSKGKKGKADNGSCQILFFSWKSFAFSWAGNEYKVKFASIFALSLAVGLVGGIYGVGGGAIMSPFLISFFNLPVYVIAGATLLATFLTSVLGVIFFSLLGMFSQNLSPDWMLGAVLGLGGMTGMYMGAASQRFMPARFIRYLLVVLVLFLAIRFFVKAVF